MKRHLFYINTFFNERIALDLSKVNYAKEYDENRTEVYLNGMREVLNIKFDEFTDNWELIYD